MFLAMAQLFYRGGSGLTVSCREGDFCYSRMPKVVKLEGQGSLQDMRMVMEKDWADVRGGAWTAVGGSAEDVCLDVLDNM